MSTEVEKQSTQTLGERVTCVIMSVHISSSDGSSSASVWERSDLTVPDTTIRKKGSVTFVAFLSLLNLTTYA